MLKLNSITFKDDETGRTIEVHLPDGHVTSNQGFTPDEFVTCNFYARMLVNGGISETKKFVQK